MTPETPEKTKTTPEKRLTKKQRTILEAILFLIRRGELPTVREVGSLVGLRSPATVLKHLRVLERASLISVSGKSRGIRIANPELLERVIQDTAVDLDAVSSSEAPSSGAGCSEAGFSEAGFSEVGSRAATFSTVRPLNDALQAHLPGLARLNALSSTPRPSISRGAQGIPLVGAIAAGQPFESYSDGYVGSESDWGDFGFDDFGSGEFSCSSAATAPPDSTPTLGIDPKVFCDSGDVLALKVEGDSMVNAGILDGDYAIIRRQNTVEEGEIAAVIINGEGTLKRWRTRPGSDANGPGAHRRRSVSLQPENDNFAPIEITEDEGKEVLVIGKYVGLIRGIQPLL